MGGVKGQTFSVLPGTFAICRMGAHALIPSWAAKAFVSITRTDGELSIVCDDSRLPEARAGGAADFTVERGWSLLKLHGPFPLDTIGVLASVAKPLAEAGVSLFALSTFETDYLLVREIHVKRAVLALTRAGHELVEG